MGLPGVRVGYVRLGEVTGGYRRSGEKLGRNWIEAGWKLGSYTGLHGVTRGYRGYGRLRGAQRLYEVVFNGGVMKAGRGRAGRGREGQARAVKEKWRRTRRE